MIKLHLIILLVIIAISAMGQENPAPKPISGGFYTPLYGADSSVYVADFLLDEYPVTNQQYIAFVKSHPKWQKSKAPRLFNDENYLNKWQNDSTLGAMVRPNSPVTTISWFAAKEYCACQGKRLPTMDEWEYAAMASETKPNAQTDSAFNRKIIEGYELPKTYKNEIGSTFKNYWGIYDLHGLVWEWTSDFNSIFLSGESRQGVNADQNLFCGSAALNATNLMNYAAFMRYALRGSVKANYTLLTLGFRCSKNHTK